MLYNVYCDESCHLENDNINVMALGAVWCPQEKVKEINERIRMLKARNGVAATSEIKWTKVGPAKKQLYMDIIDYFFDNDDLHFRCLIVTDKSKLNHQAFNQTHDDWYYKMYFNMLKVIFSPRDNYEVYIDIKDTNSTQRAKKLHDVCCNDMYDFSHRIIHRIQPIRSHEVQIMQITDILLGAVAYINREFEVGFEKSNTKLELIEKIRYRCNYKLTKTTLYKEEKMNIFIWDNQN